MKTENLEQKLHDYYREMRNQPTMPPEDDIDDNMLARYIEGIASPEEVRKIETLSETNKQLKTILQTLTSQDLNEEHQTQSANVKRQTSSFLNLSSLSKHTAISILSCAACLVIIITGSFFIAGKIKSSPETSESQITLRGVTASTNVYQLQITNKNDNVD